MPLLYDLHPAIRRWRTAQAGGNTTLNATWQEQLRRDPDLRDAVVCVSLVFGLDHEVRLANRRCRTVSGLTGQVFNYDGILGDSPELTWSYTPGTPSSSAKSLSFVLPRSKVDPAALVRQARVLAGVAEVSLQLDGGDWDQRLLLMRGDMTSVAFDAARQLVSCTIEDPKDSADVQLPPYTLTADRFASIIENSIGAVLAVVLPEYGPIPAYFVDSDTSAPLVVVAHGHLQVEAVYVDGVAYTSASLVYPWSLVNGMDAQGEPYTGVQFTGGTGTFDGEGGEKVYVELSGGPTNGSPVSIVRWLVERHTNLGRAGASSALFGRAESRTGHLLGRCAANAGGSSGSKTISFIEGTFLPSFPMVSMVWAGGGYGPVVTDRRDNRPVRYLTADQHPILDRATSVQEMKKSDCYNRFGIYYGYDALNDEYAGYLERTPANSALCALSDKVVGARYADPVESLWITTQGVAEEVLDWQVAHQTLPALDVGYDVSPGLVVQLMLGDNVALTDPEFAWADTIATVTTLTFRPARGSMGLRVWNDAIGLGGGAASAASATGYTPGN